jgi:hypothetical protein
MINEAMLTLPNQAGTAAEVVQLVSDKYGHLMSSETAPCRSGNIPKWQHSIKNAMYKMLIRTGVKKRLQMPGKRPGMVFKLSEVPSDRQPDTIVTQSSDYSS